MQSRTGHDGAGQGETGPGRAERSRAEHGKAERSTACENTAEEGGVRRTSAEGRAYCWAGAWEGRAAAVSSIAQLRVVGVEQGRVGSQKGRAGRGRAGHVEGLRTAEEGAEMRDSRRLGFVQPTRNSHDKRLKWQALTSTLQRTRLWRWFEVGDSEKTGSARGPQKAGHARYQHREEALLQAECLTRSARALVRKAQAIPFLRWGVALCIVGDNGIIFSPQYALQ